MPTELHRLSFDRNQLIKVLEDLLTIAQVAMPEHLLAIDPRIQKARAVIGALTLRGGSGRVPSVPRHSAGTIPFIGAANPSDPWTGHVLQALDTVPGPQWDITEGLDRFMATEEAPSSRQEAIELILREWLTANGHMPLLPAKEDGD